jgi:hypothetical protein
VLHLLFGDLVSIVSDEGMVVGEMCTCVSLLPPELHGLPETIFVKVDSLGKIGNAYGTRTISARLTTTLETIEEQVHEYFKV